MRRRGEKEGELEEKEDAVNERNKLENEKENNGEE